MLQRIKNDEVEYELPFANTSSELPEIMQGIYWMDQRGVSVKEGLTAVDPDYRQVGGWAADELLVTFGEARWNPDTNCAGPVTAFGNGWTYMDQGGGRNQAWSRNRGTSHCLDFCSRSDSFEVIDIHMHTNFFGFWFRMPRFITHLMIKPTAWGLDRHTTAAFGLLHYHYPVLRIVDGKGARTAAYSTYERWANNVLSANHPAVPKNQGNGTSLVGRMG